METFPGPRRGPDECRTQGKATEDDVHAFAFKWDRAGNSSQHHHLRLERFPDAA